MNLALSNKPRETKQIPRQDASYKVMQWLASTASSFQEDSEPARHGDGEHGDDEQVLAAEGSRPTQQSPRKSQSVVESEPARHGDGEQVLAAEGSRRTQQSPRKSQSVLESEPARNGDGEHGDGEQVLAAEGSRRTQQSDSSSGSIAIAVIPVRVTHCNINMRVEV